MARTYAELRACSVKELQASYDSIAPPVMESLAFFRDEILRREVEAQTSTIRRLTWAITFMTLVNTGAVLYSIFRSGG
jgi:hypothetical protein